MLDEARETAGYQAATDFQFDLYRYWRAAREMGALAVGARGYVALSAFRKLTERLSADAADAVDGEMGEVSAPRLLFIRRLLERLDLVLTGPDQRLHAADPTAMAAFVDLPLAERLRRCVRVWVAGGWWPDVVDGRRPLPALRVPAPPRVALARRGLLYDLLALPPGATLPVPASPLAARPTTPGRSRARAGEDTTERAAMLGPLRWLGVVAPGTRDPIADVCRATPALDALRGAEAGADLVETCGRIIVQSNFEIVAYPPLVAPVMFLLDCCAEPRGTQRAARYVLTRHALARARRLGWPTGAVATRLAALVGGDLPRNVVTTLGDWDRQADRLALRRPVSVLEVQDAALLDALLGDGHAATWVVRRLAPGAALIQEQHIADVRGWLLRRGELPALEGHVEETAPDRDGDE